MADISLGPEGNNGGGNSLKPVLLALTVIVIGLSVFVSNLRSTFKSSPVTTRNGLGDDIPIQPRVENLYDINTLDTLEGALNLFRGTTDINLETKSVEGFEPYAEIVLPEGIDPGPLQWGEVMPESITANPLLDQLLGNGSIMLANNPNFGVDYSSAFQAAKLHGSALNYPTKSGKAVTVSVTEAEGAIDINVTDALAETQAHFWVSKSKEGILRFGLYSRGEDGNTYHNDFYAEDFFLSSASWIGLENIQGVDAAWSPLSSNMKKVNDMMEKIILNGIQTEEVPMVVAIRNTFTARMAAKLGFTEVIIHDATPDPNNLGKYLNMNISFRRPSDTSNIFPDALPYNAKTGNLPNNMYS